MCSNTERKPSESLQGVWCDGNKVRRREGTELWEEMMGKREGGAMHKCFMSIAEATEPAGLFKRGRDRPDLYFQRLTPVRAQCRDSKTQNHWGTDFLMTWFVPLL